MRFCETMMIERLGVVLAIILHTTLATLHAHSLSKRDLPLPTDFRELSSGPGLTTSAENDDKINYRQDHEREEEELGERKKYDEDDHKKPEVHSFGPLKSPKRRNKLEQFQQDDRYFIEPKAQASLESQKNMQPNSKRTDRNPKIARVKRSERDPSHFSYIHPEEWSHNNPECSGKRQSPVDLDSHQLVDVHVPSTLIWTGYWNRPHNLTLVDNGHTVELSGTWDEEFAPYIRGGPLVGEYLFAQLHFHWGPKDSVGSEHTINNNSFPMEMHMVHYKREYETLKEALKHDDGLAVMALLFKIGETSNFGISLLENSLSKIENKPKVRVPVKPFPLALLHFIFEEDYASYIGSLTTPPCREIVIWVVCSNALSISRKQLESFRKISNKWPEKRNYRPRQALNGRRLYHVARSGFTFWLAAP